LGKDHVKKKGGENVTEGGVDEASVFRKTTSRLKILKASPPHDRVGSI
jgi:hypothetical protein